MNCIRNLWLRTPFIVVVMPVLIVAVSALVTFLAVVFGFFFLRSKLGLQDGYKNQPCNDEAEVNQSGDSLARSSKPWPIESDNQTKDGETVSANDEKFSSTGRKSSSKLRDFPKLDQIVNRAGDGTPDQISDPVEFCGHLQSEIKKTKQRVALEKIQSEMTREQRDLEREVQRRQLEEIFLMMEEQKEKFGMSSVDDVRQQMRLYIQ